MNVCISVNQIKFGFIRPHCGSPDSRFQLTPLGALIESDPSLFSKDEQEDADNLILTLFLMVEASKGKASRWYPFLSILNPVDEATNEPIIGQEQTFFCDWDPALLDECQDTVLVNAASTFKIDVDLQWDLMRAFLLKHVDFFGPVVAQWKDLFRSCYALVCTTCFDDGFDKTLLVPFGHCMNHSHIKDTAMFFYNTRLHLDPLLDRTYFDGPKFLTDARVFYEHCQDPSLKAEAETNDTIKGFQVNDQYIAHAEQKSLPGWLADIRQPAI